jgi:hypothetical protein
LSTLGTESRRGVLLAEQNRATHSFCDSSTLPTMDGALNSARKDDTSARKRKAPPCESRHHGVELRQGHPPPPPKQRHNGHIVQQSNMSDIIDPFPCTLRCKSIPDPNHHRVLCWHSPVSPLQVLVEEGLIDTLVPYRRNERGMYREQPTHRVHKLRRACGTKGVSVEAALSLRRHHMKAHNPHLTMGQLRLGSDDNIRESARLFEQAVADFLRLQKIPVYSESEQKAHIQKNRQPNIPYPPTPDFILHEPLRIKTYTDSEIQHGEKKRRILQEMTVHCKAKCDLALDFVRVFVCVICAYGCSLFPFCFLSIVIDPGIECKMFYGASTIRHDGKSAVGSLLNTAHKYNNVHGPGAMIFMQGFGDRLATELKQAGVLALDCHSTTMICLDDVVAHQRTWSADRDGNILP